MANTQQRPCIVLATAGMALLALGACNKEPATTQTPPSAVSNGSSVVSGVHSCAIVSPAEAAALLGLANLQPPDVRGEPPVTACMFANGRNPMAVTLRFEAGRNAADFATIRKSHDENGQATSDLPGLGDAACSYSLSGLNGVTFLHKNTVVLINARAEHEKLVTLGRVLIQRM